MTRKSHRALFPSLSGTKPCRVSARLCRWVGIDGLSAMKKPVSYRFQSTSTEFFKFQQVFMQINVVLG
jgi:hypothetical protein